MKTTHHYLNDVRLWQYITMAAVMVAFVIYWGSIQLDFNYGDFAIIRIGVSICLRNATVYQIVTALIVDH